MGSGALGDLSKIIDAFSAAAINPSLWDAAMDATAQHTGSVGSLLLPLRGHLPSVPTSQSVGELAAAYFRDGWYQRDERYRGVPTMMRYGVMCDLDFAHPDEFAHSAYYQELLARFGVQWFAGIKIAAGEDIWCLAIQRSVEQGPFSPQELRRLSRLSKNLSSVAALAQAMGFARAEAALQAFEVSNSAVVLLDRAGAILRANMAAERLLASPDLHVMNKRIVSKNSTATANLDHALYSLLWRQDALSVLPPVVLPRQGGRPILAYASRLPAVAADAFSPCQAILVLVDLEAHVGAAESDLMSAFHLSRAEARLASRLAAGLSIEEGACKLGIGYETARTQLKAVFAKTGTHRQSELVALLSRL